MATNPKTRKKSPTKDQPNQNPAAKRPSFDYIIADQDNKNLSRNEIESQILRLSGYLKNCDSNIENLTKQIEKLRQGDIDQKLINRSVEAFDLDNPFSTEV